MLTSQQRPKGYFDTVDSADFQYENYDLFHVAHDKYLLESTLLDNRSHAVADAGGVRAYLADRPASILNHNNSLGGFFFEHMFPYYSHETTAGPLNHHFADRIGNDGRTYQDYAGRSLSNFQSKIGDDHQADHFATTDDFYHRLQTSRPHLLNQHPNIHPASSELGMGVDNKNLDRDIADGREAILNPLWFVDQVVETEALAALSLTTLSYVQSRSFDELGNNILRFSGQQAFVMGSERALDLLPGVGLGHLTGHGLVEAHNLELYGGLTALYAAGEILLTNSDMTRQKRYSIIARRSQVVGTKIVVSKAAAIVGAKIAGLSTKGATLGGTFGPAGAVAGAAIGLGVGATLGWYWHYQDVKVAEEHYSIFTEALREHLQRAPA